jgi:N-dimethylarginine dimethylaminohydrolase
MLIKENTFNPPCTTVNRRTTATALKIGDAGPNTALLNGEDTVSLTGGLLNVAPCQEKALELPVKAVSDGRQAPSQADVSGECGMNGNGRPGPVRNCYFLDDSTPAGNIKSTELSDLAIPQNSGKIRHIVMKLGADPIEEVGQIYERLLTLLPESKFTFILESSDDGFSYNRDYYNLIARLSREGKIKRENIVMHEIGGELDTWFQDSSIVKGNTISAPRRANGRATYQGVLKDIIAEIHDKYRAGGQIEAFLEGGNKIATGTHVFIGSDAVRMTRDFAEKKDESPADGCGEKAASGACASPATGVDGRIRTFLQGLFPSQKPVILGDPESDQAVFHIDMGFVPLGKRDRETGKPLAVVGDTMKSFEILRKLKRENPEKFAEYDSRIRRQSGCRGSIMDAMRALNRPGQMKAGRFLDKIAEQLEKEGFTVKRVPYIGFQGNEKPAAAASNMPKQPGKDQQSWDPDFPWFAYTNGLVNGDTFIMPCFGIDELDDEAKKAYKECGYEVETIPMSYLSKKAGALNCMTLVIEREYTP